MAGLSGLSCLGEGRVELGSEESGGSTCQQEEHAQEPRGEGRTDWLQRQVGHREKGQMEFSVQSLSKAEDLRLESILD